MGKEISLEKQMSVVRQLDIKLWYQIRLGVNDIELFTKREDDKFYVKVDFEKYGVLPDIDYTSRGKREGRSKMKLV